ncbi:putative bifunctional diguanylate cyclase/phosphodiesterase [Pleomorphomonas oryzae]|uniref:putative bifunctional diguanylate cyclase/phosphodiesterase n=1 Tax=Pleomorphomonas oryzae TaxID=261934 RepID=UPI00041A7653|nr:EAL domain-containing protein [Pleomorphomonas oryzae]
MLLTLTQQQDSDRVTISPTEIAISIIDTLLIVFIGLFAISTATQLRDDAIEKQLKIETSLADVMTDEFNHSFQATELVLAGVAEFLKSRGVEDQVALAANMTTEPANEMLRARISGLSFIDALTLIDQTGRVLATTRVWPAPAFNFGDRQYFKVMQSMAGGPTYLSPPIIGRIAGGPNLVLSHRLTTSSDRFLGVINAATDQTYFANQLARVDLEPDSVVAFILDDGTIMAQSPPLPLDRTAEANPPRYDAKALLGLPQAGGLIPAGVLGGRERYTAVRRFANFPAAIVVSVAAGAVDDEIRRTTLPIIIASLVICTVIVIVTGLWGRQLRRDRQQSSLRYRQARTDTMTGLANRLCFVEWLERLNKGGPATPFALYFVDLDYFKTINDTLGHDIGDKLLMAVAERLTETLTPDAKLARLGGDEFAIVRTGVVEEADALRFADAMVTAFRRPFLIDGQQLSVSSSIGVSLCPRDGSDLVSLLKNADLALFKAKTDGRGLARVFSSDLAQVAETRRKLQIDLEEAWEHGQFYLVYQPIFETGSHRLSGFEALLRWRHPERGEVPPDQFIAVAEETGLIIRLGAWVLEKACADAMNWPDRLFVSINLSPVQFRDGAIEAQVKRALEITGLPSRRLELEITESILLQTGNEVQSILAKFRASGISIVLDDFGTGYSSLRYLVDFKIDRIKVDRCFVVDLVDKPESKAIVQAILALAASLGLKCTAEGIETEEQAAILSQGGCSHLQGYLLGRPLPPDTALDLTAEARDPLAPS